MRAYSPVHLWTGSCAPARVPGQLRQVPDMNMFGNWLAGVDKQTKARIRIAVCAFVWAIWNCRNDVIFNKIGGVHFLQVVHKALYWIHLWSFLLPPQQRGLMDSGCTRMMAVVWAMFNRGGWQHTRRIHHV